MNLLEIDSPLFDFNMNLLDYDESVQLQDLYWLRTINRINDSLIVVDHSLSFGDFVHSVFIFLFCFFPSPVMSQNQRFRLSQTIDWLWHQSHRLIRMSISFVRCKRTWITLTDTCCCNYRHCWSKYQKHYPNSLPRFLSELTTKYSATLKSP